MSDQFVDSDGKRWISRQMKCGAVSWERVYEPGEREAEQVKIAQWRMVERLKLAKRHLVHARERYSALRAAYYETLRQSHEDVN